MQRNGIVWRRVLICTVCTALFGSLLFSALLEVLRGHAAEVYQNVYGMPIHYVSVLTVFAALAFAFVVALVLRWWHDRDIRKLDRMLGQIARRQPKS